MAIIILLGVSLIIYILVRCMPVDYVQQQIDNINQGGATVDEDTIQKMY